MVEARTVRLLDHGSLFLHVATSEEIECERQAMEAAHGEQLAIFRVTHETRSGARVTRVEWEILS
ncbi:hypothetical protein [Bradyrhizobium elkanii]|uniref:hypothetical protein n=1 Tax=Bradyrhizobium elkanii TaxID=29448 RepID=UPI0004B2E344|nr:hypothetical protein [Bradyrhizobium elkanii]WLA79619.1 hypothetical protein QNJ99_30010 [Bradyrhizobium elkanii]